MAGTNKRFYPARARNWTLGLSSNHKEQVAVELVLPEGSSDGESLTWYGYFTDATFDRTVESLRYMGWEGTDLSDGLPGLDAKEVSITVEDEEYEGKVTAKVQWINKPGGVAVKTPLVGDEAKAFGAAMKDRIRALDAAKGTKPAQQARPAAAAAPRPTPATGSRSAPRSGAFDPREIPPPSAPPPESEDGFNVPF